LVAEPSAGFAVGTEVTLNSSSVVSGDKAIYAHKGKTIFVEMVALTDVPGYRERKAKAWEPLLPRKPAPDPVLDGAPLEEPVPFGAAADAGALPGAKPSATLRERLGLDGAGKEPPGPPGGGGAGPEPGGATAEDGDDVRTLWVVVDEQGVRHKPWKDVVVESWHEPFAPGEGQKLRGPSTVVQFLRAMDPDPRCWLEKWRQLKKLELSDRVMHELTPLVESLQAGGSYDCLNLPSLLSFEIIVRRIYQVTDAYANPGKISWANSKYFRGTVGIDEIVPQEMRSFVHRESRAEVELAAARARTQSLGGTPTPTGAAAQDGGGDGDGAWAAGGDSPAAPRGRGGKRGGGKGGGKTRNASSATQSL
jgi:hypothetical protein